MAYDRYEGRRESWRDNDHRGDDRGFFEKAGDEISSWFGNDEGERRREHELRNRDRDWNRNRDFDNDRERYAIGGWGERQNQRAYGADRNNRYDYGSYGRDWDNDRNRLSEQDRGFGSTERLGGSSRDYGRSSYDRGFGSDSSSSYGSGRGGYDRSETAWGRDDYRNTSTAGSGRDNDRHYGAWRQRQLNDLDRDYEMYCRERQDRFENDFGTWRNERQTKRQHLGGIQEHMDVVGSDGETIGKVDCVKGDRIVLTKSDSEDNRHHSFDCSLIDTVEGNQLRLQVPAEEAKSRFDQDDRSMFGRGPDHEGPNLERSFSGTYTR